MEGARSPVKNRKGINLRRLLLLNVTTLWYSSLFASLNIRHEELSFLRSRRVVGGACRRCAAPQEVLDSSAARGTCASLLSQQLTVIVTDTYKVRFIYSENQKRCRPTSAKIKL